MWEVLKGFVCYPIKIGGNIDHVHILCKLSIKIALATLVKEVKAHSSRWIKTKDASFMNFYWQNGYGAFSVSPNQNDLVAKYIANQHEHHGNNTFKDELLMFLRKYKIDFNEYYLLD